MFCWQNLKSSHLLYYLPHLQYFLKLSNQPGYTIWFVCLFTIFTMAHTCECVMKDVLGRRLFRNRGLYAHLDGDIFKSCFQKYIYMWTGSKKHILVQTPSFMLFAEEFLTILASPDKWFCIASCFYIYLHLLHSRICLLVLYSFPLFSYIYSAVSKLQVQCFIEV